MARKVPDPDVKALPDAVENMLSPEAFASEATFISIGLGVVTITFTSLRWDNASSPPRQQKVVIGRLTMPIAGARNLAAGLTEFLGKHGIEPPRRPDDPKQVQ